MAAVIYNCKVCKVGKRVEYPLREGRGASLRRYRNGGAAGRISPGQTHGAGGKRAGDGVCACGRFMEWNYLSAATIASVPCDSRCTNARGHKCDCSCGGKNHGAGWTTQAGGLFTELIT